VGALSVVDSAGRHVAAVIGTEREPTFVMTIGDVPHYVDLGVTGFTPSGATFYWSGPNCTGQRLVFGTPGSLIKESYVINGTLYYPVGSVAFTEIGSFETYDGNGSHVWGGACTNSESATMGGVAGSMDLSTLGFTPPFRIQ
jgi:hypothetical protein